MRSSGKMNHEKECDKCLIDQYQEKKTGVLFRQQPFFPGFLVQSRLFLGQPWDTMCFANGFGFVFQNQLTGKKNKKKLIKVTYARILALIGCKPNETSQDHPVLSSPRLQANAVCEDSEVDVSPLLNVL